MTLLSMIPSAIRLDDSTDAGFNAKQAQAQRERLPIYLDRHVYSDVGGQLLPGVQLISDGAGGFAGPGIWEPTDHNIVEGLVHVRQRCAWRWGTKVATTNFVSRDELAIECDQATSDSGAPGSTWHTNLLIENMRTRDCGYAQQWRKARNVLVDRIDIGYSAPENAKRGIEINGGQDMEFRDWRVRSGRTGIICSTQAALEAVRNIRLVRGEAEDVSEESLGIVDTRANEPASTSLYDVFTVRSATQTHLTLDWTTDTIADPKRAIAGAYAGRQLRVLTGPNHDEMFQLSGAPGWTLVNGNTMRVAFAQPITADQALAFMSGDVVAVVTMPVGVQVIDPSIRLGSPKTGLGWQTGISCWGGGYGCEVFGGQIFGGPAARNALRLAHVSGIAPRAGAYAKAGTRAQLPVSGFKVNGLELFDCDVTLSNWAYGPSMQEAYRNFVNVALRGDSRMIRTNWRDQAGVEGAMPAFA